MSRKTKVCRTCGEEKPLNKFARRSDQGEWAYRTECKECTGERQRKYREKRKVNRTDEERQYLRKRLLKYHHGLTLDDYNRMFAKAGGCCEICGIHQSELKMCLVVDHDHKINKVRGLLCTSCNLILGHTKDDPIRLRQMIRYLKKYIQKHNKR